MIECCNQRIYYKKRKTKKVLRFIFIVLIILGILLYYKTVVENFIINICSDTLKSYSTQAVNDAVLNIVNKNPYRELIKIDKNDNGDIVLISTDSLKANELNKTIAKEVEKDIKERVDSGINIPIMAFTGIKFLSGYGFNVNIKTINITSVECDFDDEFISAGINQTMHSLYISINTSAVLNMPTKRKVEKCTTRVLLGEAVIVGKVPEIYLSKNAISS